MQRMLPVKAPGQGVDAPLTTHAVYASTSRSLPSAAPSKPLLQATLPFSQAAGTAASDGHPEAGSAGTVSLARAGSTPELQGVRGTHEAPPVLVSGNAAVPFGSAEELTYWAYPTNKEVREYQVKMTEAGLFENTLIALPTGLGKTLIAAVIMFNFIRCDLSASSPSLNTKHAPAVVWR